MPRASVPTNAAAIKGQVADSVARLLDGRRPDLVLMADLLYWNGSDIFEPDMIEPLTDTRAAALTHGSADALAICAFRERWAEHEDKFVACCEDRGLHVQRLDRAVVAAHSPAIPQDADERRAPARARQRGKQSSLAALLIRRADGDGLRSRSCCSCWPRRASVTILNLNQGMNHIPNLECDLIINRLLAAR